MARRFSNSQRVHLYMNADGRCQECGVKLTTGWHADHVIPWVLGGPTETWNGQALCGPCNLRKGGRTMPGAPLREWQEFGLKALRGAKLSAPSSKGFLLEATPGAGKTRFTCEAIKQVKPRFAVIVVPQIRLRYQWATAGHSQGLNFKPNHENGRTVIGPKYHAVVTTYPGLARQAKYFARLLRDGGLLVLDEIHHCGEELAWGEGVRVAGEAADLVLGLSGTPFRTDNTKIPFVRYSWMPDEEHWMSVPDYQYPMADAIRDRVIRPPEFACIRGDAQWVSAGNLLEVGLSDVARADEGLALRSALRLDSEWLHAALVEGVDKLQRNRGHIPDAKGIVFADDQLHAEGILPRLERIAGRRKVHLAISKDGKEAQKRIEDFAESDEQWLVTVRMVGEGVDIPKLLVGIHATTERTPLAFNQRNGRVLRTRGLPTDDVSGQQIIPSVPSVVKMAREVELRVAHVVRTADSTPPPPPPPPPNKDSSKSVFILGARNGEVAEAILHGQHIGRSELEHAARVMDVWNGQRASAPFPCTPGQMALFLQLHESMRPEDASEAGEEEWQREKKASKRVQALVVRLTHARGHTDYAKTWTEVNDAVGEYTSKGSDEAKMRRREEILIEWLKRENAGV